MKIIYLLFTGFLLIFLNCSNKTMGTKNELNQQIEIKYGNSIDLKSEGLIISFLDIQDSRCPKEVNCMTEGKAKVQLQIQGKELNETIELVAKGLCFKTDGSCGTEAMVNDYKVKLFTVNPYPLKKTASKEKYVVAIEVSK